MTTLPDGSALAADRDRLARHVAREWKLLEHHLPAGHYLFAAEEVPLELDIFTHHDEPAALVGNARLRPGEITLAQPRQLGSCIESEYNLVRFLVAPVGEPAPLAHDTKTALRQHTNRRGVVARGASVKRTGCLHLQELL